MQKHVNLVDLVKSFPTNIFLQNLASIQKRTSPIKFAHLAENQSKIRYRTFQLRWGKGYTRRQCQELATEIGNAFFTYAEANPDIDDETFCYTSPPGTTISTLPGCTVIKTGSRWTVYWDPTGYGTGSGSAVYSGYGSPVDENEYAAADLFGVGSGSGTGSGGMATASPTASATASPTASATASPTASATASPTARAYVGYILWVMHNIPK